ncbi:discoidin domain-containing protein [Cohnella silvisoli]|uniref:Discoidin domain-containing protein n=1 Tax=Cohnella silvisoli TaxID=2873699 RepID=A0ABV1KWY7_9BACL|nr:discoidin domain-containing protein [Cohnella silvisoli]MCD9023827.1 discoidin domain-containing protein [Cohnella silvisoli]
MVVRKISLVIVILLIISGIVPTMNVSAATQASYYVDYANGSDLNSGTINSPFKTVEKAKDTVRLSIRNMTGDIIVYLRGGTYPLTHTLQFDQGDSGTNGYNVVYKNYNGETPVISGGKTITGWTLFDASKNIWEASVDASLETRQIYVNGTRAIRAKSANGLPGAVLTSSGYTTTDTNMQNRKNKSDIEFVYRNLWIEPRVGVASISGTTITMKQPAWDMAFQGGAPLTIKPDGPSPTYIENAYELLDEQGEWYLDRSARKLYYKPRAGENMGTADVMAAYLNTLVSGTGNLDNPVHNIQFEGITFAYATWLYPNGNEGYTPIQASVYSKPYASEEYSYDLDNWNVMPANISFSTAKNIRFERNKFMHLGASALGFSNGSQDNVISGNEFTDVSGTAVQIGGVSLNDSYPQDVRYVVKNNQVTNNYIHNIAVEYRGCVGVFVGYTEGTLVSHNEIADLPYTAITMGWGWGDRDFADKPDRVSKPADRWRIPNNVPSTSKNNVISQNHIHNIMSYLKDGGGIYNLGAQPGGVIEGNYIHHVNDEYGAIYLDSGSRYITVANNILHNYVRNFILAGYDNDVEFNYWNADNGYWFHKTGLVANNYEIGNANVPASILDHVGLEAAYADLLPRPSVNFALGKPTAAYYNDGTPAIMQNNTEAYRAVDGNLSTVALAANQYAWTEEVDLGNTYLIDRVVTTFATNPPATANLWATDYEIQVSLTGGNGNFTTVKTVTGSAGGTDEQTFTPVNARYVRIKAIKPDGGGQTGSQMAIAELAVYGKVTFTPSQLPDRAPAIIPIYNLALGKKATGYYNDGTPALMQAAADADKAVDGNPNSGSIAANQYAWTLEVDLGSIYSINRVKTLFIPGLYANEYEIQVSTTGGNNNFKTVKLVSGSTGGLREEIFAPVNARYVRIKALKPDGAYQAGTQMAINELEVYEYFDYAFNKKVTAYNSDGSLASMLPGAEADKSVDGDTTTGAMTANQYAWTEVVDLGSNFDIERISVIFGKNNYPTDFEMAISTDGVNYSLLEHVTNFGADGGRAYGFILYQPIIHREARYVRLKANKPDGPNQTGTQMKISEFSVYAIDRAIKMSQKTDNQAADKFYYRTISNQSFTFAAGDIISYDVKLNTDNAAIGGIDIKNTDNTSFSSATWQDQNGITGSPMNDLRAKAFGKWYHRELTVPANMVGKTAAAWMLAFENDSVSKVLQATYDNVIVKRGNDTVLTVYKSGQPSINVMNRSSHFDTDAPVNAVNRK